MNDYSPIPEGPAITVDVESRQFMNMLKCTPNAGKRDSLNLSRSIYANTATGPLDDNLLRMSTSIRSKISSELKAQKNPYVLQVRALPSIPTTYQQPLTQHHVKGKNVMPVCANEAHIKATNNGYTRNSMGGFFAH